MAEETTEEAAETQVPVLSRLAPAPGAVRPRKRKGRGIGSGLGKTCGKGQKGQKTRRPFGKLHFEGGQMPLQRRLPKVGFNNIFSLKIATVNVSALSVFEAGSVVDAAALRAQRLVRGAVDGVKILGEGDLERALTFKVDAVSKSAREKIEKAGGSIELIPPKPRGPKKEATQG